MTLGLIDGYLENKYKVTESRGPDPTTSKATICLDEYQKVCRVCTVQISQPKVQDHWFIRFMKSFGD